MQKTYTIQETAKRTQLPATTLRYYERIGLIMPVTRSEGGHRAYTDADIEWIEFIKCMRKTMMPLEDLRQFCQHHQQRTGLEERLIILQQQKARVQQQLADLEDTLTFLTKKVTRFEEAVLRSKVDDG